MRSLYNIWFLAWATFIEGIRYKVLWAVICLAVVLTAANLIVTTLFSWDLGKVSIEFGLSATAISGLFLVFFFGLKILSDDLERRRIYMVLSRPVTVWEYLAGKYFGVAMILLSSTAILGISTSCSMFYVLSAFPAFVPPGFSWQVFAMALWCQWLTMLVVLSLVFFWFSLASNSFIALFLSISSYMVGENMELLRRIVNKKSHAGILSGQENLLKIVSWIFPNLSLFDKKYQAAYGFVFSMREFFILNFYAFSYSLLLLWFAALLFKRKEFI